jgi:glutamate-ammonia-ligase adenylyltransferase
LTGLLPHLLQSLSTSASPDRALVSFERFAHRAGSLPELFHNLAGHPRAVEILMALFSGSQFLTEILLRNPEYFERLAAHKRLATPKESDQIHTEARAAIAAHEAIADQLDALRRFQRLELLRIGICDLLDLFDLPAVTVHLASLADGLVRACLEIAATQAHTSSARFAVIALGKLGGQELNYSSDIDLLFVAAPEAVHSRRLGERLVEALARVTAEGFLYRVDMRLRPWGKDGALVPTLSGYLAYLQHHARPWEKQALLKARWVAGDPAVAEEFLCQARPLILDSLAETVRSDIHAMKQRTEAHLRQQGRDWGEVKLGEGSIRDVEFVAQYLQLAHGALQPEILTPNTLGALARLQTGGLLNPDEHRTLKDGYIFLRTIEHYLQMMHYQQTSTLPADPGALVHLGRRLGFTGGQAGDQLLARYQQHCAAIRAVYLSQVGNGDPKMSEPLPPVVNLPDVPRHLARMDPSYALAFSSEAIKRHAALADQLDEDHLVKVEAAALDDGRWRVTIVAYDYPGELSLICGLLLAFRCHIHSGEVFTYEPLAGASAASRDARRKIVDVFTVQAVEGALTADVWARYEDNLAALLRLMQAGQRRVARGELAKRVAMGLSEAAGAPAILYPIDIEFDNTTSERATVLHIDALDTTGFLYELTNALASRRIYIERVVVATHGNRVHDMLFVNDVNGNKITDPEKQRELRAAIVLIKHFTHLLPHSPNPESALLHFREFIERLFQRPNWPTELASLERPEVLDALAQLLGVSDFLWDDFLRMQYANLFPLVTDVGALAEAHSRDRLQADLNTALAASSPGNWRAALNAFKDRELFRADMRHILGYTPEFGQFSQELTDLAEVVVESAVQGCLAEMLEQYGSPALDDGSACPLSLCALGKFGGRELGFASDIELMFIYAGNGQTRGPRQISTAEFYEKLVQVFLQAIHARQDGTFHVDLRLRPYGDAGSMAVSLDAFRRYFHPEGPAWAYERQALVKLRPVSGDPALGKQVEALRDQFVYNGEPFDVTAMRAMRERQIRHLVTGGTFNAKFSPGGLLDVEYLVQGLQINHGPRHPEARLTNTRAAMAALAECGVMSADDFSRLRKAHTFLRWLIDSLRVVRGHAKDMTVPPADSEEFAFLARRLRYGKDLARLRDDLRRYTTDVQELNARLL